MARTYFWTLGVLFTCFIFILSIPAATRAEEPYRIGVLLEVSGVYSPMGTPAKMGAVLTEEKINKEGGINGRPIQCFYYDTNSDAGTAVKMFNKLVQEDKVCLVIGPIMSASIGAIIPLSEKAKIPVLSMSANLSLLEPKAERRYIFSPTLTANLQVPVILDYLKKRGIKKIGVINVTDPFGEDGRERIVALAPKYGIKVVGQEKFKVQDVDTSAQLIRLKDAGAQSIIGWGAGKSGIVLTQNYMQLGLRKQGISYFNNLAIATPVNTKLLGDNIVGMEFLVAKFMVAEKLPDSDPIKPVAIQFQKDWQAKYNKPLDFIALLGELNIVLAADVLKRAGTTDGPKLQKAIETAKNVATGFGVINMSPDNHVGLSSACLIGKYLGNDKWEIVE